MKVPVSILCSAIAVALLQCACETTDKAVVSNDAPSVAVPAKSLKEEKNEVFTDFLKTPLFEKFSKVDGCHMKMSSSSDKMAVQFYVTRSGKCRIDISSARKRTLTLIYKDKMSWSRTDKNNFVQVPEMNPEMERVLFFFFPKMQAGLNIERETVAEGTLFTLNFEDKSSLTYLVEKDGFLNSVQRVTYSGSTSPSVKNLFFTRTKDKKGMMPDLLSVHMPETGSKIWTIDSIEMIGNDKMKDDLFCVSEPENQEKEISNKTK